MTYKEYRKAALAENPELRKEYEALASQYDIIDAVIAARIEKQMTQAELAERADTKQSNSQRTAYLAADHGYICGVQY